MQANHESLIQAAVTVLGGGTLAAIAKLVAEIHGKKIEAQQSKDSFAFESLRSDLNSLRKEVAELKAEIRIKDERLNALLLENYELKAELKAKKLVIKNLKEERNDERNFNSSL